MKTGLGIKASKCLLVFFFILLILLVLAISPLFNVAQITVSGNINRPTDELIRTAGLDNPINIFAVSTRGIQKALLKDPYINGASITKDYINRTIDLNISERMLRGYVEYMPGTFLYIDETGRILEVSTRFTEKLPVIVGLDLRPFTVGQLLDAPHQKSFETLTTLAQLFHKHGLESDVIKVSLQDNDNTRLYVGNIAVDLGDIRDADVKLRRLKRTLPELEKRGLSGGFLDLTDISKPTRFRALT